MFQLSEETHIIPKFSYNMLAFLTRFILHLLFFILLPLYIFCFINVFVQGLLGLRNIQSPILIDFAYFNKLTCFPFHPPGGVVGNMLASHAVNPGSIPGRGDTQCLG